MMVRLQRESSKIIEEDLKNKLQEEEDQAAARTGQSEANSEADLTEKKK